MPAFCSSSASRPGWPYATATSNSSLGRDVAKSNTYRCAPPQLAFVITYKTFLLLILLYCISNYDYFPSPDAGPFCGGHPLLYPLALAFALSARPRRALARLFCRALAAFLAPVHRVGIGIFRRGAV